MDIHDLKIFLMIAQEGSVPKLCSLHIPICYQCDRIFLMIAQACSVSGNTYRNGCKRYAQERLHDKKKVDK